MEGLPWADSVAEQAGDLGIQPTDHPFAMQANFRLHRQMRLIVAK